MRGGEGPKPNLGYSLEELRYHPAEHLLEALTTRQLGVALGVNKDTLGPMKRDPSACVDTGVEWDDEKIVRVRRWLERT